MYHDGFLPLAYIVVLLLLVSFRVSFIIIGRNIFPNLAKDDIWTSRVSYNSYFDYMATGNYY